MGKPINVPLRKSSETNRKKYSKKLGLNLAEGRSGGSKNVGKRGERWRTRRKTEIGK